jgi:flagellar biosynthesis protein FlhG
MTDQAAGLRNLIKLNNHTPLRVVEKNNGSDSHNIRVISVTSGKGGVGKTSITANLAEAFQRMRKRVLILDADLGLANMDIMLGLNPKYTISHVLKGEKTLDEVIITAPGGFKLLPAASGIPELTNLDNSQRLFLIDTGAGISSNVMYFNYAAMERIVVVTNEPTSLTDAYALIKVLIKEYHQKRFKVLINLARSGAEADRIFKSLSMVADRYLASPALDYIGWIPYDKQIPAAVRKQKVFLETHPDTPASRSIMALAKRILAEDDIAFEGDIKFFWRRLLEH